MDYAEIERRNRDQENRSAELDKMFAEYEQRRAATAKPAEVEPLSPSAQKIRYESDSQQDSIYSPAPDFMKPSSQDALDYARITRPQKIVANLAEEQSNNIGGNPNRAADLNILRKAIHDNGSTRGAAGHPEGGAFVPFEGIQVLLNADGTRTLTQGMKVGDTTRPTQTMASDLITGRADPEVVIMRDPDSGRGGSTPAKSDEVAELKAIVLAQQYQINQLIARLSE